MEKKKEFQSSQLAYLLFSLLFACGGKVREADQPKQTKQAVGMTTGDKTGNVLHVPESVHKVKCGCAIKGIGKCGEFIEIDGRYIPILGDLNLGPMPFCHKTGLKAKVKGNVKDGKFVFETFHLIGR